MLPHDPMAGDKLYFDEETTGFVDRVEIILEDDMVYREERVRMGYIGVDYKGDFVLGAIIPDFDHHSSVINRRLLAMLEIALKIIIPGVIYQILSLYGQLEFPVNIGISVIVLVALLNG